MNQKLVEDLKNKLEEQKKSIQKEPTEVERGSLQKFLVEFVRRRPDLDLDIFPESFLKWAELKYVV